MREGERGVESDVDTRPQGKGRYRGVCRPFRQELKTCSKQINLCKKSCLLLNFYKLLALQCKI